MPLVTVILPAYNAMPYASGGGFDPRSDADGPKPADHRRWIQRRHGRLPGEPDQSRIDVIRGSHCGLGAVLNRGLDLCRSEFLARMDADDLSSPRRLEQQLAFLRRRPDVGMLGSQFDYIGGHQKRVLSPPVPCDHPSIMAELLRGNLAMVHASAVFRTAALCARLEGTVYVESARTGICLCVWEKWHSSLIMSKSSILIGCIGATAISIVSWPLVSASDMLAIAPSCAALESQEPTPDAFREKLKSSARFSRMMVVLDAYALLQYRLALVDLADERKVRGYTRLGWAASVRHDERSCACGGLFSDFRRKSSRWLGQREFRSMLTLFASVRSWRYGLPSGNVVRQVARHWLIV